MKRCLQIIKPFLRQMSTSTSAITPSSIPVLASLTIDNPSDQVVTPWDVKGAEVDGKLVQIDYKKLIEKFGTKQIDDTLIQRLETVTKTKAHHLIRRGLFFSHRDLNMILDRYEKKKPFYLYTGRGYSTYILF